MAEIIAQVASYTGVTVQDIQGQSRKRKIVYPRHMVCYLAKKHTNLSYPQIGKLLGGRDHSTVIHGEYKFPIIRNYADLDWICTTIENNLSEGISLLEEQKPKKVEKRKPPQEIKKVPNYIVEKYLKKEPEPIIDDDMDLLSHRVAAAYGA